MNIPAPHLYLVAVGPRPQWRGGCRQLDPIVVSVPIENLENLGKIADLGSRGSGGSFLL